MTYSPADHVSCLQEIDRLNAALHLAREEAAGQRQAADHFEAEIKRCREVATAEDDESLESAIRQWIDLYTAVCVAGDEAVALVGVLKGQLAARANITEDERTTLEMAAGELDDARREAASLAAEVDRLKGQLDALHD